MHSLRSEDVQAHLREQAVRSEGRFRTHGSLGSVAVNERFLGSEHSVEGDDGVRVQPSQERAEARSARSDTLEWK